MEIATDLLTSLRDRIEFGRDSALIGGFDWSGLHARLAAAHAANAELRFGESSPTGARGAFSALRKPDRTSRAVNPTDLADGKPPAGINCAIAGQAVTGDRG